MNDNSDNNSDEFNWDNLDEQAIIEGWKSKLQNEKLMKEELFNRRDIFKQNFLVYC